MNASQDQLGGSEHDRILREKIIPLFNPDSIPAQENPKAIILAGQPGAGKGGLAGLARSELGGNAVLVDPDALRDFHPRIVEFRDQNPLTWAGRTQADAGPWADGLVDDVSSKKKNLILDATLANGEKASDVLIKGLMKKGYEVEVWAVIAHKLESDVGVDERFARGLMENGYGRYVPKEVRDAIYDKIPDSLETIHVRTGVAIREFTRDAEEVFHSHRDQDSPRTVMNEGRIDRLKEPAVTQKLLDVASNQPEFQAALLDPEKTPKGLSGPVNDRLRDELLQANVLEEVSDRTAALATINEINHPDQAARLSLPDAPNAGLRRAAMTAGVAGLGLAATAYDAYEAGERVSTLLDQKNPEAAKSEALHFAARGVGGWAGGSLAAAAVGSSGLGPMALIAADAYLFSKAFEKAADLRDNNKIYKQEDKAGQEWEYNGRSWVREAELDRSRGGMDNPVETKIAASYEKTQELNAKASAASITQELGKAPAPQNPFNIPARPEDQRGLDNTNWQRDPQTEQWTRQVKTGVTGANDRGVYAQETATPERAQALDREAVSRIEGNITNGREAVAAAYLNDYATRRFEGLVKVPEAVEYAKARPDAVLGSDSQLYQRNEGGQWTSGDTVAQGNMALELELTRQIRQPTLEATAAALAEVQARPAPTAEEQARSELVHRYQNYGVTLPEEWMPAIELAVERTRQANGIIGLTMQEPKLAEGAKNYDNYSPIVHYQTGADGVARVVATTSTADLKQAFNDLQAQRLAEMPIAELPELRITPLSAQERDAHDQALREANRQGASTEQAAQAASVAALQAAGSQVAPERTPPPEPTESRQPAAQPAVATATPPLPEAAVLAAAHTAAVHAAPVQAAADAPAVRPQQPTAQAAQAEKAQEQARQREEAATTQREQQERSEATAQKPQAPEAPAATVREPAPVEKPEQAPVAQANPAQDTALLEAQRQAAPVQADPTQAAPIAEPVSQRHTEAADLAEQQPAARSEQALEEAHASLLREQQAQPFELPERQPEVQPQAVAEPTPSPRLTPHDPAHPDHPLYEQIREKVEALDAAHGRSYDETSERLTGSLLVLARSNGLERVDHVMLSVATAQNPAAHNIFVVQGELNSPQHQRASMETAEALKPSFEASMNQLEEVKVLEQERTEQLAQQQQREQEEMQQIAARSM